MRCGCTQGRLKRGWHGLFPLGVFPLHPWPDVSNSGAVLGNLPCPHSVCSLLHFMHGGRQRLFPLARGAGVVGQTRPPRCSSGRQLSSFSLKERELGWWKTPRTSGPRGFEKQEVQEAGVCPGHRGPWLQTLFENSLKQKKTLLLPRVNSKGYRTLALALSHPRDFRKCAQRKGRGQA